MSFNVSSEGQCSTNTANCCRDIVRPLLHKCLYCHKQIEAIKFDCQDLGQDELSCVITGAAKVHSIARRQIDLPYSNSKIETVTSRKKKIASNLNAAKHWKKTVRSIL